MRKAISLLLACVILITAWSPLTASAAFTPTFDVVSESAYLVNTDTGKVVYEKNKDKQLDPASLTKMMTCIIALEQIEDLEGTTATAPSYVFDELYGLNASNAGIMVNETLTMKDLLYALMLSSACEAAGIIADYISDGNPEQFVEMMNTKAKEIGCQNTVFKNPSGLEADGQVSTAYDMFLIASYGMSMKDGRFKEIATTQSYTMAATNKHSEPRRIVHTNFMLNMNLGGTDYFYEYVKGIKTGTSDTYRNLATSAVKDGYNYICVVMGAPIYDSYGKKYPIYTYLDTKNLYKWVFESFEYKTIANPGEKMVPNNIKVELAKDTDALILTIKEPVVELMPSDIDVSTIMWDTSRLPETVQAPVKAGDVIGEVDLKLQGEVMQTVTVVAAENVERSTWLYVKSIIKNVVTSWWFILIVAVLVLVVLAYIVVVVWHNKKRKHQNKVYHKNAKKRPPSRRRRKK